jgi:putative addiction module component (TIGR02574 family)
MAINQGDKRPYAKSKKSGIFWARIAALSTKKNGSQDPLERSHSHMEFDRQVAIGVHWPSVTASFSEFPMTTTALLDEIRKLSVHERYQLLDAVLDSIASDEGKVSLDPAQLQELDRRLAAYRESPETAEAWPEVRSQLLHES